MVYSRSGAVRGMTASLQLPGKELLDKLMPNLDPVCRAVAHTTGSLPMRTHAHSIAAFLIAFHR